MCHINAIQNDVRLQIYTYIYITWFFYKLGFKMKRKLYIDCRGISEKNCKRVRSDDGPNFFFWLFLLAPPTSFIMRILYNAMPYINAAIALQQNWMRPSAFTWMAAEDKHKGSSQRCNCALIHPYVRHYFTYERHFRPPDSVCFAH